MQVLVDYDNCAPQERHGGVESFSTILLERLWQRLDARWLAPRVHIRLYGGWYIGNQKSPIAQSLSVEIQAVQPFSFQPFTPRPPHTLPTIVSVELAQSLIITPTRDFFDTYRTKQAPKNLNAKSAEDAGCLQPDSCGLRNMRSFFRKKCCPEVGCLIDLHQFMSRSEQKLVDVMLSTDALHLAMNRQEETLVVVSSDHDIWPAIHYSALVHPRVAHLHTRSGQSVPQHYSSALQALRTYHQVEY